MRFKYQSGLSDEALDGCEITGPASNLSHALRSIVLTRDYLISYAGKTSTVAACRATQCRLCSASEDKYVPVVLEKYTKGQGETITC